MSFATDLHATLADEKQRSREKDRVDLESGKVTRDELGRRNTFIPAERTKIDWSKAVPLK